MYIDLNAPIGKYSKHRPPGATVVGACCNDDGSFPSLLVWSAPMDSYIRLLPNGQILERCDAGVVFGALAAAHDRIPPTIPTAPTAAATEPTGPMKLRSVSLDEETVRALRDYGNGNLSAGIRAAAKLVTGT